MYKCKKCETVFNYCDMFDSRLYPNVPYGTARQFCPTCKSTEVSHYDGTYCGCCGMPISHNLDYCSDSCRKMAAELYEREERRRKIIQDFELSAAIREVDDYNRENGTRLSYGKYFSLKGEGKI